MALHFVTAAAEEDHVDSSDDARRNAGTVGSGNFVFGTGNKMAGSMTDPNTLRILDGDAMISGRHWNIDNYEEVVIENGTPGMNRWDLVVANAKTNPSEVLTLKVYKGVETEGEPVLPSYIDGDLNGTDTEAEQPLYAVLHTGLSVGEPVAQFEVWMSESEFRDSISQGTWITLISEPDFNIRYCKVCGIVFVHASSSGAKNIGGAKWVTIGTLPAGYRPDFDMTATLNGAGADLGGLSAQVGTDGAIECYTSLTSAVKYWNFVCSFPA